MAPKLDAAIHLHELTRELDLAEFILFSSALGVAWAARDRRTTPPRTPSSTRSPPHRHADGLPALALAFGFWERETELTRHLTTADGRRAAPLDTLPMSDELGLELINTARHTDAADARADAARPGRNCSDRARLGILPPILSGLVRTRPPRAAARRARVRGTRRPTTARPIGAAVGPEAIRAEIAASLGYESAAAVDMELSFLELGFDSLVSLELRKRLQAITGLSLSAKMMFDHPTPAALIDHLQGLLNGSDGGATEPRADGSPRTARTATPRPARSRKCSARAYSSASSRTGSRSPKPPPALRAEVRRQPHRGTSADADPAREGRRGPDLVLHPVARRELAGRTSTPGSPRASGTGARSSRSPPPASAPMSCSRRSSRPRPGRRPPRSRAYADGRPVALVGFSTGGLLAYAVARECAREGDHADRRGADRLLHNGHDVGDRRSGVRSDAGGRGVRVDGQRRDAHRDGRVPRACCRRGPRTSPSRRRCS